VLLVHNRTVISLRYITVHGLWRIGGDLPAIIGTMF